MTLRTASFPVKVLFTCFLLSIGIGYLMAVLYLFLIDIEPHSKKGTGMVRAVIIKYYGQRGGTRLEGALEGAMGDNLSPAQKKEVVAWIRKGATEADFPSVQPIFTNQCAGCHSKESGMPLPPLTTYEEVSAYTQIDLGQSIKSLVRVSHIHLFGISFIFMFTSGIFVFSEVNPRWRALLVAIPFLAIWVDIGSWWFTKLQPLFAYAVIIGGLLMGLSLALQIVLSLYEMWLKGGRSQ
ncbi:MAG: hypothetical protein EPO39_04490 [Candidatus Manganitrophaceae bacterium]|nr:MAG: hypothetical protein EPO39_04490 [Candidatus Manganitrophaceae bacterium]